MKKESKIYIAKGNTYPHRETFASWAWHWDKIRKAWVEDNGSRSDDPCIMAIRDLPGVLVKEVTMIEESFL